MMGEITNHYIGKKVKIIKDGKTCTVVITDTKWDEVVWNPATQSDGAWMFQVRTEDNQYLWGYRHNMIIDEDN